MALQDGTGTDLEYAYGVIDRECGVDALDAGQYFFEVYTDSFSTYAYDLVVICEPCAMPNPTLTLPPTRTPTPTPLIEDSYEPDDTLTEAADIDCGSLQSHSLHQRNDADWVAFTLPAASAVSVATQPDIEVALFDLNGNLLSNGFGGIDFICPQGLSQGRFFVRTLCSFCEPIPGYNLSLLCSPCAPLGSSPTPTPTATPSPP